MSLTSKELSCRYICDTHFVSTDYTNENKSRLNKHAVPIQYKEIRNFHVTTPNVYKKVSLKSPVQLQLVSKSGSLNVYIQTPNKIPPCNLSAVASTSSTPVLTPTTRKFIEESHVPTKLRPKQLFSGNKVSKLKFVLEQKKKQINSKNVFLFRLKNKLKLIKNRRQNINNVIDSLKYPSKDSKVLVRMQTLRAKASRKPFTKAEQNFALSLFYKSLSTYTFLRNNKKITLPGMSNIRRWIGNSKFRPGFNAGIFRQLKIKCESMNQDELYCTLIFDEMKIKHYLEYSKFLDCVEGYEDLGSKGRTNKLAGQAMVFMIRGLYSSWKMPICYFLPATSVKNSLLSELLIKVIQRLLDCGFIVKAVICDQGTNNVAALKLL